MRALGRFLLFVLLVPVAAVAGLVVIALRLAASVFAVAAGWTTILLAISLMGHVNPHHHASITLPLMLWLVSVLFFYVTWFMSCDGWGRPHFSRLP